MRSAVTLKARWYSRLRHATIDFAMNIRHATRFLTFALLAAFMLAPGLGCQISTSDRDLVYRRPAEAVEMANTPTGAFGSGGPPKVLWLDPRTTKEYDAGHISQAISLPFPEIEKTHEVTCKGYDMYIVYDNDYDDVIGKAAAKRLLELGYKNVYNILGGLKAWKADGNAVTAPKK